jgi:hypothetical protein
MTKHIRDHSDAPDASAGETTAAVPGPADARTAAVPGAAPGKILSPEAVRALEEAEARRKALAMDSARQDLPTEVGGRDGPEATRYGDWEKKGLAVDF